ncbi:hypothetical protein [Streptomyces vilmorinianum]|uniref:hypothetical protein n=1 Tax=Streptomyces vilmorinianum TaxID=3051092 RepID=UPI0010FB4529|nr:hypothetical protein [Streptomyces vilmorinianum]
MADERYEWLDPEAAERLLRGEPVEVVGDHARVQAERLAEVLASARFEPLAQVAEAELPGEAAALAAFRKATAERGLATSPSSPRASAAAELGGVRLAPVTAARRWGRSLRFGLAAAVAAVAVGGVAVASGSGMLPFDSDRPAPAGSVSALDTPDPNDSGSPEDGFGTATPSVPPSGDGVSPGVSPSASPSTPAGGSGGETGGTPEPGTSAIPSDKAGKDDPAFSTLTIKACQDYRAGRIDDSARRRLADSARKDETVRQFCDRVLAAGSTGSATGAVSGGSTRAPSGGATSGDTGDGKGDSGSSDEGERAGSGSSSGAGGQGGRGGQRRGDTRSGDTRSGDTRSSDKRTGEKRSADTRSDAPTTGRDKGSDRARNQA